MPTALDAATVLEDLRFPPGNGLEALFGDRQGQHCVPITRQWRGDGSTGYEILLEETDADLVGFELDIYWPSLPMPARSA